MDRAASCRRAARDAVADVEPSRLQELIGDTLERASMAPGVLTLDSAAAVDADVDTDGIAHRAAGVQLIYEGLRLTRTLAHEEPWTDADVNGEADLQILAADILVARGFYLLARTEAAGKAVRTVQSFGRDQTLRQDARRDDPDAETATFDESLERDVLELAVLTGAAAVGQTPTPELIAIANDVAADAGTDFPPAETCLPDLSSTSTGTTPGDVVGDRATSAGDP